MRLWANYGSPSPHARRLFPRCLGLKLAPTRTLKAPSDRRTINDGGSLACAAGLKPILAGASKLSRAGALVTDDETFGLQMSTGLKHLPWNQFELICQRYVIYELVHR